MIVSGGNLSLFGRTALSNVGSSRVGLSPALEPVDPTDPLRDATSSEYQEFQDLKERDRELRQHEQAHTAAGGAQRELRVQQHRRELYPGIEHSGGRHALNALNAYRGTADSPPETQRGQSLNLIV